MSEDRFPNPFPNDPDRHAIWEMLMRRDFEAFIANDWSMTAPDFAAKTFYGIDCRKQPNPDHWSLTYPSLEAYRDEWLRQADEFEPIEFVGTDKLGFFFDAVQLRDIDINGDHAVAHKKFLGSAQTTAGNTVTLRWQTLYQCRRVEGVWKIASFVGYMPHPMPHPTPAEDKPSDAPLIQLPEDHSQHAKAGPYSPSLIIEPGRTVAIAGQGPLNDAGEIMGDTIEEQTAKTLDNCAAALQQAGAGLSDVYKVMVYLDDLDEWSRVNTVYRERMSPPYPVRTAIQCKLWGGMKIEIDMLARL
ncbi:MAG: RidA family protein [Planctomycetota bacterium]